MAATLLSSCATYQVIPFNDGDTATKNVKGFRFYTPQPYLCISKNPEETATLDFKILYLPDYSRGYILKNMTGLGKSELNFKLENGWNLVEFGAVTESQIPETITAIGGLLESIKPLAEGLVRNEESPEGLYYIDLSKSPNITLTRVVVP